MSKRVEYFGMVWMVFFLVSLFTGETGIVFSEESGAISSDEEAYNKALRLKEDGDYTAAGDILKNLTSQGETIKYEINYIDTLLDQCIALKEANDSGWKTKAKEAGAKIKALKMKKSTDADFYLIYAKYSWVTETKRESNITKALEKAFYYKPNYTYAYIVKGDIYFGLARNASPTEQQYTTSLIGGASTSARHSFATTAKASYQSALSTPDINNAQKAYVHFKLGELENQMLGNRDTANENWEKAASLTPDSKWSKLAKKRLEK